jgi:lipopolysaccharide export system permease protein
MTDNSLQSKPSRWRFTPRILDRYVAREFLISYLIAIAVVLSLRIIMDCFLELDEFLEATSTGESVSILTVLWRILDYYGPKTFEYFRDFSGTIIVMAAAFSLTRLTRQNELTAVLASGVSLKRIIAPIVLLSVLMNMLMVFDQEFILPHFADKLIRRHDETEQLRTVRIWLLPDKDGALVNAPLYDPQTKTMENLLVIFRRDGLPAGRLTAKHATWDPQQKNWILTDGLYYTDNNSSETQYQEPQKVLRYDSSLTADYLWLQRHTASKSLMSSSDLSDLLKRGLRPTDRAEAISEKHFRVTDPIINMVMLLLGLPMLVSREQKNTKTAIALVLLGTGGCFLVTFACKILAGGSVNPLLLAWLPIIIFLPLSIFILDAIKT